MSVTHSEGRTEAAGILQGLMRWGSWMEPLPNARAAPPASAPASLPGSSGGNNLPAIGSYIDLHFVSELNGEIFSIPGMVITRDAATHSFTARPLHDDGGGQYDESIECNMLGRNDTPLQPLADDQQEWSPLAFSSLADGVNHVLDSAKIHCQRVNFDAKVRNLLVGGHVPEAKVRFSVGLVKPKRSVAALKSKDEHEANVTKFIIDGRELSNKERRKKMLQTLLARELAPSAGVPADLDSGGQQEEQETEDEVEVEVEEADEDADMAADEAAEVPDDRRVRPRLQGPAAGSAAAPTAASSMDTDEAEGSAAQVDDLDARLQAAEVDLAEASNCAQAREVELANSCASFRKAIASGGCEVDAAGAGNGTGAGSTLEATLEASSVTLEAFSGVPQLFSALEVARDALQAARVDVDVKADARAKLRAARDAKALRELAEGRVATIKADSPDPTPNPRHSEAARASYARFVAECTSDLAAAEADLHNRRAEEEAAIAQLDVALAPRTAFLAAAQL